MSASHSFRASHCGLVLMIIVVYVSGLTITRHTKTNTSSNPSHGIVAVTVGSRTTRDAQTVSYFFSSWSFFSTFFSLLYFIYSSHLFLSFFSFPFLFFCLSYLFWLGVGEVIYPDVGIKCLALMLTWLSEKQTSHPTIPFRTSYCTMNRQSFSRLIFTSIARGNG